MTTAVWLETRFLCFLFAFETRFIRSRTRFLTRRRNKRRHIISLWFFSQQFSTARACYQMFVQLQIRCLYKTYVIRNLLVYYIL